VTTPVSVISFWPIDASDCKRHAALTQPSSGARANARERRKCTRLLAFRLISQMQKLTMRLQIDHINHGIYDFY